MSQPDRKGPPFRVVYSELCRDQMRDLLVRAGAMGRFAEVAQALRGIHQRLEWIPLDFGEPLQDFHNLGLKEFIGVMRPLVVKYAVDEARGIVYVSLPFDLLSKSGL